MEQTSFRTHQTDIYHGEQRKYCRCSPKCGKLHNCT